MLGYEEAWLEGIPEGSVESFAGTGNPFSLGEVKSGEHVVDVGCGAGFDSLIAARMVGPKGMVIGVDMTAAMIEKGRAAAAEIGLDNVEFRMGYGEELPLPDGWADTYQMIVFTVCLHLSSTFQDSVRLDLCFTHSNKRRLVTATLTKAPYW